ncbi:hypothetical protein [Dyadobacter sp. 676]|uniref:Uncharacterized protein n=1 Tax=Dyadobacter sp. 676 TaxID=3088362 RepID=A0AAU8FI04_9BACT
MKIVELTRIVPERLWTARFEENIENEFDRAFSYWNDAEYLDAFFTTHERDLVKDFYGYCSVSQAVSITMQEADEFERQLLRVAHGQESERRLGDIFKPLTKPPELKSSTKKAKRTELAQNTGSEFMLSDCTTISS